MKNRLAKLKNGLPEAGMWRLFTISLPLMLSSLSSSLMLLCDRLFLAQYSLSAFNSIVTISSIIFMLQIGVNVCASAADVFVGQLNGADNKSRLSAPTWQMIWFSLFTSAIFLPIAYFLTFFYSGSSKDYADEIFYFRLLIAICPLSPLHVALSSFFIGRKQTVIPLLSTLIGNAVNLVLNYLLIFGLKPLGIPEIRGQRGGFCNCYCSMCKYSNIGVSLLFKI